MASFLLSFFPLDVLDEIWDLIESVSKGFLTYSYYNNLYVLCVAFGACCIYLRCHCVRLKLSVFESVPFHFVACVSSFCMGCSFRLYPFAVNFLTFMSCGPFLLG